MEKGMKMDNKLAREKGGKRDEKDSVYIYSDFRVREF